MNIKEINTSTNDYILKTIEKRYNKIISDYISSPQIYENTFFESLDTLFLNTAEKQKIGKKKKVKFISFFFLYSDLLLGRYKLRVNVFDENMYCDEIECVGDWNIEQFFEGCGEDFNKVMSILSSDYIKVTTYEKTILYRSYLHNYYTLSFVILKNMVKKIPMLESYQALAREDDVVITLGEYMDKMEELYHIHN